MCETESLRVMRKQRVVPRTLMLGVCVCVLACVYACANTNKPSAAPVAAMTNTPSASASAATASNVARLVYVDFQCVDMCTVLVWLAEFTGDTIIADPGVRGPVTIVNPQPTTPERAREIIFSVLKTKGFTAIRKETDKGAVVRIVPAAGKAPKPVRPPLRPHDTPTKER